MNRTSYVDDILAQPATLADLLGRGVGTDVARLLSAPDRFERVILTGMGASLHATVPSALRLAAAGLSVWNIETAELLGQAGGLITPRTLLCVVSQSGESAEVAVLLARLGSPRPTLLAVTNAPDGALAAAADAVVELHSGQESSVSSKSYVNTLAALSLVTDLILAESPDPELHRTPAALQDYLVGWDEHVGQLEKSLGDGTTYVLGRGASMAAVLTGALIVKEAARRPAEGMSVPQFRHGPLELAGPDVTVVVLAGALDARQRNLEMLSDLAALGTRSVWLDPQGEHPGPSGPSLDGPTARTIGEILPLQLASVVLAARSGFEPGAFRNIQKVTRKL